MRFGVLQWPIYTYIIRKWEIFPTLSIKNMSDLSSFSRNFCRGLVDLDKAGGGPAKVASTVPSHYSFTRSGQYYITFLWGHCFKYQWGQYCSYFRWGQNFFSQGSQYYFSKEVKVPFSSKVIISTQCNYQWYFPLWQWKDSLQMTITLDPDKAQIWVIGNA